MYTWNDHAGHGIIELVQNLLLDFDKAQESWKEQWAICEGTARFLLRGNADTLFMLVPFRYANHFRKLLTKVNALGSMTVRVWVNFVSLFEPCFSQCWPPSTVMDS